MRKRSPDTLTWQKEFRWQLFVCSDLFKFQIYSDLFKTYVFRFIHSRYMYSDLFKTRWKTSCLTWPERSSWRRGQETSHFATGPLIRWGSWFLKFSGYKNIWDYHQDYGPLKLLGLTCDIYGWGHFICSTRWSPTFLKLSIWFSFWLLWRLVGALPVTGRWLPQVLDLYYATV